MVILPLLALLAILVTYLVKQRIPVSDNVLVVLGSGGHTGEILAILDNLACKNSPEVVHFVYGEGDALSIERARNNGFSGSQFWGLPRARKVKQSFVTSVFTSAWTLLSAFKVLWTVKPQLLLCNGPGTSVMVVLAARLLCLRTRVVYIESLARVKTLSLSGKLIYHLQLANRFVVQWPDLAAKFPGTVLGGVLV